MNAPRRAAFALALAGALAACGRAGHNAPGASRNAPASANDGARIYLTNCSSCHQPDGKGIPGAFPPLAGNPVVVGDPGRPIAIVKRGSRGPIRVAGRRYDGEMPGWDGLLSDADIAAVVTYVRSAWNNAAGPVSESDVH
ncbi:MAG TPA: cytochrome c [Candidatus Tumulicola sp.]